MKRAVLWTDEALTQLGEARAWVAQHDPAAARKMAEHLIEAARRLAEFPHLGTSTKTAGLRKLVLAKPPFVIVYDVRDASVRVRGVFHHARSRAF